MNLATKKSNDTRCTTEGQGTCRAARANRPHLYVATVDKVDDDSFLGQFIPIHYHYQMLQQEQRIGGFEQAINTVVKPGMKVLELGGGTGVLSFFAARAGAAKVYCVERQPHVVRAAQRFLATNNVGDRVDVIQGDASEYLPPERVDVVVCEMLHTAMLREKQLSVIASFKKRYLERFGGPLPIFIPEAAVMAIQPVYSNYDFHGYRAAVPMFIDGSGNDQRVVDLAAPELYASFLYGDNYDSHFVYDQTIEIMRSGVLNSIRFVTNNLLAIVESENRTIDWLMHDLVIPLATPLEVFTGQTVRIRFRYDAGDSLLALGEAISAEPSDL